MDEILRSLGFHLVSDPAFFIPYLLLVGSVAIALLQQAPFVGKRSRRWLGLAYSLLVIAVVGLFLSLGSPLTYYAAHYVDHRLEADFGERVGLLGYNLPNPVVRPGSIVRLTLFWYGKADVDEDYSLFVHVLRQDWAKVAQDDHLLGARYPTSQWREGELVEDTTYLHVPYTVEPGEYPIAIGLYLWQTGERLPATVDGQRLEADMLFLPQVIVVVEE